MMHGAPLGGFHIDFPEWVGPLTPVDQNRRRFTAEYVNALGSAILELAPSSPAWHAWLFSTIEGRTLMTETKYGRDHSVSEDARLRETLYKHERSKRAQCSGYAHALAEHARAKSGAYIAK